MKVLTNVTDAVVTRYVLTILYDFLSGTKFLHVCLIFFIGASWLIADIRNRVAYFCGTGGLVADPFLRNMNSTDFYIADTNNRVLSLLLRFALSCAEFTMDV